MIRILYWNVENFGIKKINDPGYIKKKGAKRQRPSSVKQQESQDRLNFILDTLRQSDGALLDIFVLVETVAGGKTTGALITGAGEQGANALLTELRKIDARWMLVPPLLLTSGNTKEGISVFFNSANLDFTGPYRWGGQVAASTGAFVDYSKTTFPNALPNTRVSAAAGNNPNQLQNTLAGQCTFFDTNGSIGFPVRTKDRAPFLTTFWHRGEARNIKLLSYHAPKPGDVPAPGIRNLAIIPEITSNLGANDTGVIVGDFNVSVFDTVNADYAYGPIMASPPGGGYTRHINAATTDVFPQKGYLCTTIYRVRQSKDYPAVWGNANLLFGYPGYVYVTANSYDNILTRYGASQSPPANSRITIVNRVTGSPYNVLSPPTDNAPIGSFVYSSSMTNMNQSPPLASQSPPTYWPTLPLPPLNPGPDGQGGYDIGASNAKALRTIFEDWQNYGKIRSTSDHLPLIIQV